jgi:hypothetical protein
LDDASAVHADALADVAGIPDSAARCGGKGAGVASDAETALVELCAALETATLKLETPGAQEARAVRDELAGQVADHLLPRLRRMEAPLLMVVGGSTGAGKSTLVNSLVGVEVSPAGVLRPTTRAPVLVCHPGDLPWFEDDRVLGGLPRTIRGPAPAGGLQVAPVEGLAPGLALLDSPDVDSVVEANRALARQLLAAADAWLFVTTAARYADAVPWTLLQSARDRGTALCLVLDRVPPDAAEEVSEHLLAMLAEQGLGATDLLVVPETVLAGGLLPADVLAPVRAWLDGLAVDAVARDALVRRTLAGALASVPARVERVAGAVEAEDAAIAALRGDVARAYADAREEVDEAIRSGALLRGEVLARWQDVVGTGELMQALESRIGRLRDRVRGWVSGAPAAGVQLRTAVETSVDALVHAAADKAAERTAARWQQRPEGRMLLAAATRVDAASPGLLDRTREEVRAWQGAVFELVAGEAQGKRTTARLASLGVNGAGLTVMLAVFLHTGGLTGTEVVVAGGTSALSQKVLEAIFGDQAVRSLAARAREDLMRRVDRLLGEEAARYEELLAPVASDPGVAQRLRAAAGALERAG